MLDASSCDVQLKELSWDQRAMRFASRRGTNIDTIVVHQGGRPDERVRGRIANGGTPDHGSRSGTQSVKIAITSTYKDHRGLLSTERHRSHFRCTHHSKAGERTARGPAPHILLPDLCPIQLRRVLVAVH